MEGGLPPVGPALPSAAGGIHADDDQVEVLEGGLLGGGVAAGLTERLPWDPVYAVLFIGVTTVKIRDGNVVNRRFLHDAGGHRRRRAGHLGLEGR